MHSQKGVLRRLSQIELIPQTDGGDILEHDRDGELVEWQVGRERSRPLLLLVEGIHDIQFLMRLSHRLEETNSASPDLTPLVQQGRLVMVPMGGGLSGWVERLDALGCRQFHLFDRECEPETSQRRTLAEYVNSRPDCQAVVTTKRSLENYLHADAIAVVGGGALDFDDDDCVASVLARAWYERVPRETPWLTLSRRARRRMLNRAKHSLNVLAVEHMTPELLTERDPSGELVGWLNRITAMTTE